MVYNYFSGGNNHPLKRNLPLKKRLPQKNIIAMSLNFKQIVLNYKRDNFVYHHWRCTLSYPLRSLEKLHIDGIPNKDLLVDHGYICRVSSLL